MSILDNHKKIQEIAEKIRVNPPDDAWDKVQRKMHKTNAIKKRKSYNLIRFWFSIAASMMVIIACVTVIYYESQQSILFKKGKVEAWENLDIEANDFYSITQARHLAKVYNP